MLGFFKKSVFKDSLDSNPFRDSLAARERQLGAADAAIVSLNQELGARDEMIAQLKANVSRLERLIELKESADKLYQDKYEQSVRDQLVSSSLDPVTGALTMFRRSADCEGDYMPDVIRHVGDKFITTWRLSAIYYGDQRPIE